MNRERDRAYLSCSSLSNKSKLGHRRRSELVPVFRIVRLLVLVLRLESLDLLRDLRAVVGFEPDFRPVATLAEFTRDDVDHELRTTKKMRRGRRRGGGKERRVESVEASRGKKERERAGTNLSWVHSRGDLDVLLLEVFRELVDLSDFGGE